MLFMLGMRQVFPDVPKPVFLFRPVVETGKPVLPAQPGIEAWRTAYKTEHCNKEERHLRDDGQQESDQGQQKEKHSAGQPGCFMDGFYNHDASLQPP